MKLLTHSRNLILRAMMMVGLFTALSLMISSTAAAADRYAKATGNWNSPSVWSETASGGIGASPPVAGDNVFIQDGVTVTVTVPAACASLTYIASENNKTVMINPGITLTVSGIIAIPAAIIGTSVNLNLLSVGAGILYAGDIVLSDPNPSYSSQHIKHQVTISTGTVTVSGSITGNTVSGASRPEIKFTDTGLLKIGGSLFLNTYGNVTTYAGGTIEYNGANQTITAHNYHNLVLSGSGIKTLLNTYVWGSLTLSGNVSASITSNFSCGNGGLIIENGATLDLVFYELDVSGTTSVSGTLIITGYPKKTFRGDVTVNSGGTWQNIGSTNVSFRGNLHNDGTFESGSGTTTFNGNSAQSIQGNVPITFVNVLLNNSSGLSLNGVNATITNSLTLGSGMFHTGSNILTVGNSTSITGVNAISYIEGKLSRVITSTGARSFPIGKDGSYLPVTLNFTALTGTHTVTIEAFTSGFPGTPPAGMIQIGDSYWNITQSGGTSGTFNLTLNGTGLSFTGEPHTLNYDSPNTIAYPATTPQYTITGLTGFGDFAFGEFPCSTPDIFNPGPQSACVSYSLPEIQGYNLSGNQAYYDNSQANGGQPISGPVTSTQIVWIYDEIPGGCSDEESFPVTFNKPNATGIQIGQGGSGELSSSGCFAGEEITLGPNNPTASSNDAGDPTHSWNRPWYNSSNVYQSDYISADASLSDFSHQAYSTYLRASDFKFNLPANATVLGIQVEAERYAVDGIVRFSHVQLVKGGARAGESKNSTSNWPQYANFKTYQSFGGADDLWGTTWSVADVEAPGFGVDVVAYAIDDNPVAYIDHIRITLTYTFPGDEVYWYTQPEDGNIVYTGSSFNPVGVQAVIDEGGIYANLTDSYTPGTYTFWAACSSEPDCRTAADFTIDNAPVIFNPGPQSACASYTLPEIQGDNLSGNQAYYDNSQVNGGLPISGPVTSTQTVWIFDTDGTYSDEESFLVTITDPPDANGVTITAGGSGALSITGYFPGGVFSQGPFNPSASSNNAGSPPGVDGRAWSSSGNIYTSNDSRANVRLNVISRYSTYLRGSGFGFNIPSGATISGVQLDVERHASGSNVSFSHVYLVKGGNRAGNQKSGASWPTTDAYETFGGANDLWGTNWTAEDINDANFGVDVAAYSGANLGRDAYIDHIRITVTYSVPGDEVHWYTQSSGGSIVEAGSPFNPVGDAEVIAAGGVYANLTNTNTPGIYTFWAAFSSEPDCRTEAAFTIAASLTFTIDVSHVTCFGGNNGSIMVTVTNGMPDYQFSKNGGTDWTEPQEHHEYTFDDLNAADGPYQIAVKDSSGFVQTECD